MCSPPSLTASLLLLTFYPPLVTASPHSLIFSPPLLSLSLLFPSLAVLFSLVYREKRCLCDRQSQFYCS